jgi:ankyrin repeat protein
MRDELKMQVLNFMDGKSKKRLFESIKKGRVDLLSKFLMNGGNPDYGLKDGNSLISVAVIRHNVKAVIQLLSENANCWDGLEYSDHNMLASAAFYGYADIVTLLLEKGMPVDCNWCINTTALHEACMMRCGHECHAWDYSDEVDSPAEIARYVETARILIEAGANVNAICQDWPGPDHGYTPLHFAVDADCLQLVELLIANGADIEAKSEYGLTPLNLARE